MSHQDIQVESPVGASKTAVAQKRHLIGILSPDTFFGPEMIPKKYYVFVWAAKAKYHRLNKFICTILLDSTYNPSHMIYRIEIELQM